MKKILAFVLSLVLALTLVVVVACNGSQPGGNSFKEVDLTDQATREEFVNALAEKVDVEKLLNGDPTKEGWTFGVEEKASSKVDFDLSATLGEDASEKLTAKGNVELSESAKATYKNNGTGKAPDFAASVSLSAKGKVELNDALYDMIGSLGEEYLGDFDLVGTIKKLVGSNFNYKVDGYVDSEAALISLSDELYNNLPEVVTGMLGSKNFKIPFGGSSSTLAAAETETSSGLELKQEDVKKAINTVIDNFVLPYKISVAVANKNGYALRLTATKASVTAVLSGVPSTTDEAQEEASWMESLLGAIDNDAKVELTVRVDKNGALSSVNLESNVKLNLNMTIEGVKLSGTVSVSGSVEVKKFNGTVSKPSGTFTEIKGFEGGSSDDEYDD